MFTAPTLSPRQRHSPLSRVGKPISTQPRACPLVRLSLLVSNTRTDGVLLLFPKVEKGKMLARRIKELGYARDFDGMLEALEEGPKNAIVCT